MWPVVLWWSGGRSKPPLATENLPENTDGGRSTPASFSRVGGSLLPSVHADSRYIDADIYIVSKGQLCCQLQGEPRSKPGIRCPNELHAGTLVRVQVCVRVQMLLMSADLRSLRSFFSFPLVVKLLLLFGRRGAPPAPPSPRFSSNANLQSLPFYYHATATHTVHEPDDHVASRART